MNSIGNLYNRILKVARKDWNGIIPAINWNDLGQVESSLILDLKAKVLKYVKHLQNSEIKSGA